MPNFRSERSDSAGNGLRRVGEIVRENWRVRVRRRARRSVRTSSPRNLFSRLKLPNCWRLVGRVCPQRAGGAFECASGALRTDAPYLSRSDAVRTTGARPSGRRNVHPQRPFQTTRTRNSTPHLVSQKRSLEIRSTYTASTLLRPEGRAPAASSRLSVHGELCLAALASRRQIVGCFHGNRNSRAGRRRSRSASSRRRLRRFGGRCVA